MSGKRNGSVLTRRMALALIRHRAAIAAEEAASWVRYLAIDLKRPEEEILRLETSGLVRNYSPPEDVILMALGDFLYDESGRRYADFQGAYSANNVGNCNPRVTGANFCAGSMSSVLSRARRSRQLALASGSVRWHLRDRSHDGLLDFKVLPMNSGCEAIEGAVLLAKLAFNRHPFFCAKRTRLSAAGAKPKLVVCRNNFHGRSTWAKAVSSNSDYRDPFAPNTMESELRFVDFGDTEQLTEALAYGDAYAFCVEPIQCEGGMNVPPPGYFEQVRKLCDRHEALLVIDEVQTGLGRTGRWLGQMNFFPGFGVEADFIALAKSLSGGQEVASAVLAQSEYADLVRPGEHGSTFGGNPKAAATIRAALAEIEDRNLCWHAARNGEFCLGALREVCRDIPFVNEVRGVGLAIGIECEGQKADLVCDRLRHTPFIYRGEEVAGCWTNSTHGLTHETTVIRVSPPLTMSLDLMAASMVAFAEALGHSDAGKFRVPEIEAPAGIVEGLSRTASDVRYLLRRFGKFVGSLRA